MKKGTAASRKRKVLRGPSRKDDQGQQLQAAPTALRIRLCQILPLSDEAALLRVAGRWPAQPPTQVELLVGPGARAEPLPPGPVVGLDGEWTAGFQVPSDAAVADLVLVTPAGPTPLPRPTSGISARPDLNAELEEAHGAIIQLESRCAVNERELAELRGKLVDAWAEVSQMRESVLARASEYEAAQRRAGQVDAIVSELEQRAQRSEAELAARRAELEAECERLRGELAGHKETAAKATGLLERFEAARATTDDLDAKLTEARAIAHDAMDVATAAARELLAERAKAEEAAALAERHGERLACVERELAEARLELRDSQERLAEAEALAEQLRERVALAERANADDAADLAGAREDLANAEARSAALEAELAETRVQADEKHAEQLHEAHQRLAETEALAEQLRERVALADSTNTDGATDLAGAREDLANAETRIAGLQGELADAQAESEATAAECQSAVQTATAEIAAELAELRERFAKAVARGDALETQLSAAREELAKTAVDQPGRGFPIGRSRVSARVHGEVLEKLEHEAAERERAEAEAAQHQDRVRELEEEIASYHAEDAPAGVEDDLRHLLATRQRELEQTRVELQEQRARYAAVASKMSPTELAATAETRPAEDDWTALDDELLNRLARAKQLSQPD